MYEQLVAKYLTYELPACVRRKDALGELPPQRSATSSLPSLG